MSRPKDIEQLAARAEKAEAERDAAVEKFDELMRLITKRLEGGSFDGLCTLADELEVITSEWRGERSNNAND